MFTGISALALPHAAPGGVKRSSAAEDARKATHRQIA